MWRECFCTHVTVWLGGMTEYRLLFVFARGHKTATAHQIRAIKLLLESSLELNDTGETKKAIKYATCALGDHWEAQVNKEFVTALAVEASH